jgi:hypothetical protein
LRLALWRLNREKSQESQATGPAGKDESLQRRRQSQGLKGDERNNFMSQCLKGDKDAAPSATPPKETKANQQDKVKACNADAKTKGLKG